MSNKKNFLKVFPVKKSPKVKTIRNVTSDYAGVIEESKGFGLIDVDGQKKFIAPEHCQRPESWDDDDRKYWSILPPFRTRLTVVQRAVEGVHVFSQPLRPASFAPDIRLHMHAVDNEDGTISLVGALAPTRELCLQLQLVVQLQEVPLVVVDREVVTNANRWWAAL